MVCNYWIVYGNTKMDPNEYAVMVLVLVLAFFFFAT